VELGAIHWERAIKEKIETSWREIRIAIRGRHFAEKMRIASGGERDFTDCRDRQIDALHKKHTGT
jgi:hypothetical protein